VHNEGYRCITSVGLVLVACRDPPSSRSPIGGFPMSALVLLQCDVCGATSPPLPSAVLARELAGTIAWAVDRDGSDVDYCPTCTAPAEAAAKPRRRWS
jgi:hypothetical protein